MGGVIALGVALVWLPLKQAILLFGGSVCFVLILRAPVLSLYLLILLIPFSSLFAISLGGAKAGVMEGLLALGMSAWLLQRSTGCRASWRPARLGYPPLVWPFLLFLGGVGLSWLGALSLGAALVETAKWVEMVLLYLWVIALLRGPHLKWAVMVLFVAGLLQAGLGLYQFTFRVGPEGFLLFGGRFLRAYGTFAQPNPYAGYLGLGLPLALAVTIWGGERTGNREWPVFLLAVGYLGVGMAALFAAQSRGAWVGFVGAAVVTVVARSKRAAMALTIALAVGIMLVLAGSLSLSLLPDSALQDVVVQRFVEALSIVTIEDVAAVEVTDANFATIERLAHWQAAREMWRDYPWLGVGFGNYGAVYPAYAVGGWLDPLGHAHNYPLNLGAEAGLVGMTLYLIFWILTFRVACLAVYRSRGFEQAVAVGGLGILVHLHLHNMFDNLYVQGMYLHVAIILALITIIYQQFLEKENSLVNYRNYH
jgi:O-antigen ligase